MPFQKGRPKTGGRKRGIAITAIRRDVAEKLADLGFDPILKMIEIATEKDCPPRVVAQICSDLAQYLHPKRRAIELSGPGGNPIDLNVSAVELLKSRIDRIAARKPAAGVA